MKHNRFVDDNFDPKAALIADVLASRKFRNQEGLLRRMQELLDSVNAETSAVLPLDMTVGDECQGLYSNLEDALHASLLLALRAKGDLDLRIGLGWGPVEVINEETAPFRQSGQAWWYAREAIEQTRKVKRWPSGLRSAFVAPDHAGAGLVRALLLYRDQLVSRMDVTDAQITLMLFEGYKQEQIGKVLGITQSSVSSRQRNNGPAALLRGRESLETLGEGDTE